MAAPAGDRPLRVLVVDDDRDNVDSLGILLQAWNCSPILAYDGVSALEKCRSLQPDVVLLDLGLPQLDGLSVARQMRALAGMESVFLIALTGFGQVTDRRLSQEAGFDLHLLKPVDPAQLRQLLAEIAGRLLGASATIL